MSFLNFLNGLSSVCLWSVNKKKPLTTVKKAHGCHSDTELAQPHWIASVAALHNSDLVASGTSSCKSGPYQLFNNTTCSDYKLTMITLLYRFSQFTSSAVEVWSQLSCAGASFQSTSGKHSQALHIKMRCILSQLCHDNWNHLFLFIYCVSWSFLSQSGFVNSLKFSTSGQFLVAGVGQEHR